MILQATVLFGLLGITFGLDCSKLADGIYEVGCKSYAVCNGGVATQIDCPKTTVYNSATKRCDDPSLVLPPCGLIRDCTNKKDGKYADVTLGCHSYYNCNGGIYFGHNYCPSPLIFNEPLQLCDWARDVLPPCGTLKTTPTPIVG